ncbi:phage head-tail adaptor, putative, SPP1 family [Paenacidovorax caeni]|uniref:Phage head-tail adaptor, putative, SPP1 family n=1 Tax=Paenacidovorax caeni TaxID=343013 RepID=A0A1I7J980_9BURK|nr:phage head closure protein [Paenacidovorax caeni]SFU81694.1 phage head-tail adaptor, putative, SPP1 family [Paenacidovorax caeni]
MLQAGKLTQRITLQAPVVARGRSGGQSKTWTDAATDVPAAVRNLSGNERRASSSAGGEVAQARAEFTLRWRPGITAQMRVLYGGAIYNIVHVNDFMARREFLILTCDTGLNDG